MIEAFEASPVTKRKANAADYLLARKFLDPKGFKMTPEQVINGILLGAARKIGSDRENGTSTQVQSLACFENAIMEAWTDKGLTVCRQHKEWAAAASQFVCFESRIHDKKEPIKVEKVVGDPLDDVWDATRYGAYSYHEAEKKPLEMRVQDRLSELVQKNRERGIAPDSDEAMTSAMVNSQRIMREEMADDDEGPGIYRGPNARRRIRQRVSVAGAKRRTGQPGKGDGNRHQKDWWFPHFYPLFRFRALAAALEAFLAIARLCSAVIVFSRALPPRRPISARYLEMSDLTIMADSSTKAG